jgi:hypothetical protein
MDCPGNDHIVNQPVAAFSLGSFPRYIFRQWIGRTVSLIAIKLDIIR